MNLGWHLAGTEQAFHNALTLALATRRISSPFHYVEVGVGDGLTLEAVHQWLLEREVDHTIDAVDIPGYDGKLVAPRSSLPESRVSWSITLSKTGSIGFFPGIRQKFDFVFIDACHGWPCVTNDFLMAEASVRVGGIVCFHDTDPECQGLHFQHHCQMGISARKAVSELGLLDDTRSFWKKVDETTGDKSCQGHGALFVQRQLLETNDPKQSPSLH